MKSYCLKCKKDTENKNPKVSKTSNNRIMVLLKCAICVNLSIKTPLSKVQISGDILF